MQRRKLLFWRRCNSGYWWTLTKLISTVYIEIIFSYPASALFNNKLIRSFKQLKYVVLLNCWGAHLVPLLYLLCRDSNIHLVPVDHCCGFPELYLTEKQGSSAKQNKGYSKCYCILVTSMQVFKKTQTQHISHTRKTVTLGNVWLCWKHLTSFRCVMGLLVTPRCLLFMALNNQVPPEARHLWNKTGAMVHY